MTNTNYMTGLVKIIETPKKLILQNNNTITTFHVQGPTFRQSQILSLIFWGNLSNDAFEYYKINDYILIEGYFSIKNRVDHSVLSNHEKIEINVLKSYFYPLNLN